MLGETTAGVTAGASIALIDALFRLVVLSIILERALAFIFEIRLAPPLWLLKRWRRSRGQAEPQNTEDLPLISEIIGSSLKAAVTYLAALLLCKIFTFDILAAVFGKAPPDPNLDIWLTAAVVSGGSAGAIKLFQEVLGLSKTARDAARETREEEAQARLAKAQADRAAADLALDQTRKQTKLIRSAPAPLAGASPQSMVLATSQPWALRPEPHHSKEVQPLPSKLKLNASS